MKTTKSHFLIATVLLSFAGCSSENENLENEVKPVTEVLNPPDPDGENPSDPVTPEQTSAIIYTDIEPDFEGGVQNPSYDLDLNNDQQVDFTLQYQKDDGWEYILITTPQQCTGSIAENENGIISVAPWYVYTLPLRSGELIFRTPDYSNDGRYYSTCALFSIEECWFETSCNYDWKNRGDKYLGLKFKINDELHYGWAKLQIESPTDWVIKDYAYSETPNVGISAGAKPSTR